MTRGLAIAGLLLAGCADGQGSVRGAATLGAMTDGAAGTDAGPDASADDAATASDPAPDAGEADCGDDCDCDDLGPCDPACTQTYWRWSFWTTNYNVAGTLGYGEHQGNGVIGVRYRYDSRFEPDDGIAKPWVEGSRQFDRRTLNPGGETYEDAVVMPGDEDDLYTGESLPQVPRALTHDAIEAAALCEVETVFDERYFNHGGTLAEEVPNHGWDSFFTRRDLVPMRLLATIELTVESDGTASSPTLGATDSAEDVAACLDVMQDGFCEAVCGNCSYVLPTGFSGTPFGASEPGYQIEGMPTGSAGSYQVDDNANLVAGRTNFSAVEEGRLVVYVGGSSWGLPSEVASYGASEWPDPDGVPPEPSAWKSVAGADLAGADGIPDEWDDPFTHCVDPNAIFGSQIPGSLPRFISGRWGHNSNADAEASFVHFDACRRDPSAAAADFNALACTACGDPRDNAAGAVQYPCQDLTFTATSYWERSAGVHNVEDFDVGKFDAVGPERQPTPYLSGRPDPICHWSGEPVLGL